eukprot:PhM_4_TR1259/c0_g1_i3/m.81285
MTGHESVRQRNPMNPYVVHVRASYVDEASAMYKAFVTNLRLKRFAVVYSSLFKPQRDLVVSSLRGLGLSVLLDFDTADKNAPTSAEIAALVIQQKIDGAFMYTHANVVVDLLEAIYAYDPHSKFVVGVGSW